MKNYNIGLDIGTTSVGWAVVNPENFKIIKKGNKQLWGVRLFDEASTAEERRNYRSSRRRYDRRRQRIKLLQKEFKNEIEKIDPLFFTKLKEFFYNEKDTENKTVKLTEEDKKIFNGYKTIYHLRNELVNSDKQMDIRYVYLAIHHIIKYRGNFLFKNSKFSANDLNINESLKSIFNEIDLLCDKLEFNIDNINDEFYNKLEDAIKTNSINDKKALIKKAFDDIICKSFISEFTKLILGNKFSISKLLNIELDTDITVSFKDSSFEDNYSEIEKNIGDKISVINLLKELYDKNFLKGMFTGSDNTNLSSLMVKKYDEHKEDLKFLKRLLKHDRIIYKKFFKDIKNKKGELELCIYKKYVKNKISYEDFIKEINKALEKILELIAVNISNEYITKYQKRIYEGIFMPRITSTDNGRYPYQLNQDELIKIIENQGKYYPFLKQNIIDSNSKQMYKLVKLLTFRIPYYIGPLNTTTSEKGVKNKNAWIEKNDKKIQINPYNFDSIINKEASAEKFITRMVSHCTYILEEEALPNNSILYSKFKVMNELKQIKINGYKMSNEFQHKVYNNLFLKINGTITEKKFIDYLKTTEEYKIPKEYIIEGYSSDKKFANNMQSYIDFFGENGIFNNTNYNLDNAEEIIRWITIFEDKDILETKVRKNYPKLSNDSINLIMSKKYSGWGNLSQKLLNKVLIEDKVSKTPKSIMDLMYDTEENFMQILNNKDYKFQDKINKLNKIEDLNEINYSLVENLATSPATKRGIYQALKVVEEIVNYMGYTPDNIMIEMARSEEKKARKDNKKDYIIKLYNKIKDEVKDYNRLKNELSEKDKIDSQKLFLYFIQEGKSLYSNTPLAIEKLDEYEIDHIIPRTLIKDDSIDNKALVLRTENQEKSSSFVLPRNYRTNEMKTWWKHLKDNGLISSKKYNNLCRDYYSPKDIEGFINRQLVETRQITKHVANILNNFYKDTKIIYLHADLSSNYRKKYELFKYRDINDYHHAHDAYLSAVLGEYKEKYLNTTTDFNKLKELSKKLYDEGRYNELSYGYVINSIDNEFSTFNEETGEITFDADLFNKTIEDTLYRNDIIISRKTEIKTGEFYKQTRLKKGNKGVPFSDNLSSELYGYYTNVYPSYAIVVRYENKGKVLQKVIGIPIYISVRNDKNLITDYISNLLNIKNKDSIQIIKDKIPFYIIIEWKGQECALAGATDKVEVWNAKEFKIEKQYQIRWKYTLNRLFNKKKCIEDNFYNTQLNELIEYIITKIEKQYPLYKDFIPKLKNYLDIENISMELKEQTLLELFKMTKFSSLTANLKVLNPSAPDRLGRIKDKTIEHAIIVNKSVTGLMEYRNEF